MMITLVVALLILRYGRVISLPQGESGFLKYRHNPRTFVEPMSRHGVQYDDRSVVARHFVYFWVDTIEVDPGRWDRNPTEFELDDPNV